MKAGTGTSIFTNSRLGSRHTTVSKVVQSRGRQQRSQHQFYPKVKLRALNFSSLRPGLKLHGSHSAVHKITLVLANGGGSPGTPHCGSALRGGGRGIVLGGRGRVSVRQPPTPPPPDAAASVGPLQWPGLAPRQGHVLRQHATAVGPGARAAAVDSSHCLGVARIVCQ